MSIIFHNSMIRTVLTSPGTNVERLLEFVAEKVSCPASCFLLFYDDTLLGSPMDSV